MIDVGKEKAYWAGTELGPVLNAAYCELERDGYAVGVVVCSEIVAALLSDFSSDGNMLWGARVEPSNEVSDDEIYVVEHAQQMHIKIGLI